MADWDTRLVVTYDDGAGPKDISPIDSFTPTITRAAEPLHSLEATHIGVVNSPTSLTFSLTVRAIGDVAAKLTVLAMTGTPFAIQLAERQGDDWGFKTVVMSDCFITSATPSSPTIQGAPTATFSGFSLQTSVDTKAAGAAALPTTTGAA